MKSNKSRGLFPQNSASPYYIVSPPYTRFSAGVKALHLLCHHLNLCGFPAYLIPLGDTSVFDQNNLSGLDFLAPVLSRKIAQQHFLANRTPITVYPEIVSGNPFNGPCVTRYVLNFPGILGGDVSYDAQELCYSYSNVLAKHTTCPENILFIPTSDTNIFYPPSDQVKRSGSCFYASKYKKVHQGELFRTTQDSLEITSGLPSSQSPYEIAEIFRRCEVFYTYENTALAIEAALCECPVVFLPNQYLEEIIASDELGADGFAWGDTEEELDRAKTTVGSVFQNYNGRIAIFYNELDSFISKTQKHASSKFYSNDHLETLMAHLPASRDLTDKHQDYAPLLKKLPWRIEREFGALLCSLGLKEDGKFLWNRASRRSKID